MMQFQIQQSQQTPQQYLNQQEQQQQIQNHLIQQSGQQLTNAIGMQQNIHQINIQPKPQIVIGPQQTTLSTSQAQSMENRPTIMSMVSIAGNTVSSTNGSPMTHALASIQGLAGPMASPSHVTLPVLQPPQNPLAAMTTLSYNASPTPPTLTKDDKQLKAEQQKINDQLQQSAIQTLVSLSTTPVVSTMQSAMSPALAPTANGDLSAQTNTVSTSSTDASVPMDTTPATGENIFFLLLYIIICSCNMICYMFHIKKKMEILAPTHSEEFLQFFLSKSWKKYVDFFM